MLEAILQFLYTGQATISKEKVLEFFATAEDLGLGVEGLDKDIDKGKRIEDNTKYSVDYIFSKSEKEENTIRKLKSVLSNEDNMYKVVAWQKQEVLSKDKERSPSHNESTVFENTLTSKLFCTLCNILDNDNFQKHKEGHREKN